MKDRIAEFLRQQELTPSKLAEILGVQPSSISHLLSGRNKPGFDFIVKFLQRFPSVDPDWLLLGKGTIFRNTHQTQSSSHVDSTGPDLFSSVENSPKAITQMSIKNKENTNDELFSASEIETDTHNIQQSSEKNQQIEQMIICFEDHTFIKYIPRK